MEEEEEEDLEFKKFIEETILVPQTAEDLTCLIKESVTALAKLSKNGRLDQDMREFLRSYCIASPSGVTAKEKLIKGLLKALKEQIDTVPKGSGRLSKLIDQWHDLPAADLSETQIKGIELDDTLYVDSLSKEENHNLVVFLSTKKGDLGFLTLDLRQRLIKKQGEEFPSTPPPSKRIRR